MDKIIKISMEKEYEKSNNLEVIKEFYIQCPSKDYVGWIKKEALCLLIEKRNWELHVGTSPFPLVKVVKKRDSLYLKSTPNEHEVDNLLNLPRV